MKISYLFLSLMAIADATNLDYKQHGSLVDRESMRLKTKSREFGNAVMKRFDPNNSDEVSFKVSSKDNIRLSFLADNDDIEYSVARPGNGNFKKLEQLGAEGHPGAHGRENFGGQGGRGKSLDAQGIKLKIEDENPQAGEIKVKASIKPGNNSGGNNHNLASTSTTLKAFEDELGAQPPLGFFDPLGMVADGELSDTTAIAIMNPGSAINVCFEPLNDSNFVGVETSFRVGLCDKDTDMVYPNAVSSGTLEFSRGSGSEEDKGVVAIGASGEDGWAEVSFTPQMGGPYKLKIDIEATTEDDEDIERQVLSAIEVVEKEIESIDSVSFDFVDDGIDMTTSLNLYPEFSPNADSKYIIYAEISDAAGNDIMAASGMADLESGNTLKVRIQPEWFDNISGGFWIGYLRIATRDGTTPLLVIEDGIRVHSTLPDPFMIPDATRGRRLQESNEERMLRMTMGVKPEKKSRNEDAKGNLRHRELNPIVDGVILSHGYCSSSNPWASSNIQSRPNSVLFEDFDQSRTHDEFAQLLYNTGNVNFAGCSIIAHSQGGAAALHLYSYYWSCLDYGSASRMIQSVGTPYQGTSLAGNVAVLGDIFGVGCGTNYGLTYSGASSWLAGIPSWARSEVNYYTTSFTDYWWRYDYCHVASDLLLNDPDDGTVEKSKGQLSGGINRGHTTGQCHTSGMRDYPQTQDSNRNTQMASYT